MTNQFNLYSEKVMKHFQDPKNIGIIEDADGIGTVGNPRCGDVMKVYIKVAKRQVKNIKKTDDNELKTENYIQDIKVQTLGCGAAIATSSIMTEMVKGKSVKEALKISNKDVTRELDGLPAVKLHCSLLAEEGIKAALNDYQQKFKKK